LSIFTSLLCRNSHPSSADIHIPHLQISAFLLTSLFYRSSHLLDIHIPPLQIFTSLFCRYSHPSSADIHIPPHIPPLQIIISLRNSRPSSADIHIPLIFTFSFRVWGGYA